MFDVGRMHGHGQNHNEVYCPPGILHPSNAWSSTNTVGLLPIFSGGENAVTQEKLAAIRALIQEAFPGANIEEKHDFDLRAERFKIHAPSGTLLLKVSGVYLDDNNIAAIKGDFERWNVLVSLTESKALLVTSDGLQQLNLQ